MLRSGGGDSAVPLIMDDSSATTASQVTRECSSYKWNISFQCQIKVPKCQGFQFQWKWKWLFDSSATTASQVTRFCSSFIGNGYLTQSTCSRASIQYSPENCPELLRHVSTSDFQTFLYNFLKVFSGQFWGSYSGLY